MLEKLWKAYKYNGDNNAKDQLILAFLPTVKVIAGRFAIYSSSAFDKNDLVSAGVIGLLDAIEKYDPAKGASLKTYAEYRIRGAILDEIRAMDFLPRSVREKASLLEKTYGVLEQKLRRTPGEPEVADFMGISINELRKMLIEVNRISLFLLDDICQHEEDEDDDAPKSFLEIVKDVKSPNPAAQLEIKETKRILGEVIEALPEKERLVITLYYYEELTMKEIGKVLDVSESRVCQMHSSAIIRLRAKLKNFKKSLTFDFSPH